MTLNVQGQRADGFHAIESVMARLDWCDTLHFSSNKNIGLQFTCSDPVLETDSNLVIKACELFYRTLKNQSTKAKHTSIKIHLEKKVPYQAGLGGGSSNAATTLLGLNQLEGFPFTEAELQALGAQLGSDVPFFLQEQPMALVRGRGEQLEPLAITPPKATYLIVKAQNVAIPTAWAYEQLKQANAYQIRSSEPLLERLKTNHYSWAEQLFNDFEVVAFRHETLQKVQQHLLQLGAFKTLLCGSGSAILGWFDTMPSQSEVEPLFPRTQFAWHIGRLFTSSERAD